MADYSIGDRVQVRWQATLFDAAVIEVYLNGTVDVVYDIDGTVGKFLTAKEHGLMLLGDEENDTDLLPTTMHLGIATGILAQLGLEALGLVTDDSAEIDPPPPPAKRGRGRPPGKHGPYKKAAAAQKAAKAKAKAPLPSARDMKKGGGLKMLGDEIRQPAKRGASAAAPGRWQLCPPPPARLCRRKRAQRPW